VVGPDHSLHGAPLFYGFCTLPAFRQEVHTWIRLGLPSTMARTPVTLGVHRRLVRRCEWLMRMPNCGFLPQTSHTDAIGTTSERARERPRIATASRSLRM